MAMRKKAGPEPGRPARTAVVSEAGAHAALRRGTARDLSAEEEKVMRMRLGASPPRTVPLERSFEPLSDLEIEVRAAEIEAWMRWKARSAGIAAPRPQPSRAPPGAPPARSAASPRPSISKDRIIRALRKKI
jgi:hypothetical protein